MSAGYPASPWRLRGTLCVSVFVVPGDELPPTARPPLRVARHAIVGVAFARYEPGGDLAYDELLTAVVTRALVPTIPQIWVDSEASRSGARELWSIPKEMARFGDDGGIAALRGRTGRGPRLPWLPLPIAQADRLVINRFRARVRPMRARWDFAPDGPLTWLHGRRPVASFALADAELVFGVRCHTRRSGGLQPA